MARLVPGFPFRFVVLGVLHFDPHTTTFFRFTFPRENIKKYQFARLVPCFPFSFPFLFPLYFRVMEIYGVVTGGDYQHYHM